MLQTKELSEYEIKRHKPLPNLLHGFVQSNLLFLINKYLKDNYTILPEVDLLMPEAPIAVPDISIYSKLKIDFSNDVEVMEEMPLTTIEIQTFGQTETDLIARTKRYLEAGVKSCWVVLPSSKTIFVYKSMYSHEVFKDNMLVNDDVTGIKLPLNDIFS